MVRTWLPRGFMRVVPCTKRFHRLASCLSILALGCFAAAESNVHELTIGKAVEQAVLNEPRINAYLLNADAQDMLTRAASMLPTPTIRTGFLNVPVDSLTFEADPMTQTLIGVRQMIPPRGTRAAMSAKHDQLRQSFAHRASFAAKEAKLNTRMTWLEAHYLHQEITLTSQALLLLQNLSDVVRARYATGDELQPAVIAADLELNRLKSRLIDTRRREFETLARLQRLTGRVQEFTIDEKLPQWRNIPEVEHVIAVLLVHPRVRIVDSLIAVENAEVQLSESEYRPEWHIDLSYSVRDGIGSSGDSRSDFASASISFSLPIAAKPRNDLMLQAAQANADAAQQMRLEVLRDMRSEISIAYSDWNRLSERSKLLNEAILPQSQNHAQAALKAYQNKEGSFADVLLSYVNEVDTKLELHRVSVDRLKSWAVIDSLNGSTK